ncbi:gliding motility-associated C-terminal domain-containing protein [Flavobacterium aquidurense]|uniref:von Willebrand factor, type A n=1 Tax=Flavobacterium aquidurense TaxID=362413 RepID=A0A0Q0XU81_9FLAO|nr:gliding motility-associated C-terminal domain-containing protein [Flavobacterium aquidurense]KQB39789.1 Von Willebrand factor, type A [Flavobacterium aquidurense]
MEKLLLSLSSYLLDIKKIYFAVLFLLWSSIGLAQSITTNKTVTANATNCGIVNVKVDITGANPITRNSDVVLAIDISGSMGYTIPGDFKTSMDYAKDAALAFLTQAKVNPQNRIAIVAYSTTASLKIGLTYLNAAGVAAITTQINNLQATNSTNLYGGIVRSETELETNGRFDCRSARAIILLTDGVANVTGTNGNTTCNISKTSQCVTTAINAATNAKTTTKSSIVYNNQLFSVGLFGGLSGNINTNNSEQNIAKYTLDNIQGSPAYITQSGANLTSIYNQIATQISWVAQNLITKETVIPGFTIGSITTSKGTASLSGQVITWNTDFLNSETITLNYQLTPTGTACGNQIVSTSTLNYQNSSCANDSKAINTSSYFVPCVPLITGILTACGSTTLTATTNASSPTYVWYKDNAVLAGQTSATLVVTASGAYKVKVKNGTTNCELTSAESTVSISPAAALTAPANASISGCGTGAITGLAYSTSSSTITLAQLVAAGGSLPNSTLLGTYTISYSDVATGTCPTIVTRTFKVVTGCGSITASQNISITDTSAPTWTTSATALNTTLQCSDTAGLTTAQNQAPVATDNCGGTVTYTKTSGTFAASSCANSGTYTNTWIAKDVCLNTSTIFTQVITIQDTSAPTWTTSATALNITLQCSDAAGLTTAQNQAPIATDNCSGTVTYTKTSGAFVVGSCANSGTYTNTWIAKDVCLNTSTIFTQVITIQDTSAPTWTTSATALNTTLQCSDTAGLAAAQNQAPIATDNCNGTVTYTKTSGTFAVGSCANSGTYTNTWIAKDVCLNTSTIFTQVITIQDTSAPTWTTAISSLNKTIECSDADALTSAQALFPTASDLCDADVSNIVKVSGAFVASANCSNAGTYTNTWTVKDDCGNTSDTFTQVITIQDTSKPIFIGDLPIDSTVSCDAVPEPANIEASDNCSGDLPIVFSETKSDIQNGCNTNYTLTRKWNTSDCSANTATYTQIITVRDTTPPTGTAPTDVTNLQTIADIPVGSLTDIKDAADNCSTAIDITISDTDNGGSGCEGNAYILTRTYILTDCAGNKTELKQTFTVENQVSVTGVASNVTCLNGKDGSIMITNSPGSTVVIKNENNEVVGNNNLPAGTYTLIATSSVNTGNQTCSAIATVVITQPAYTIKISGQIINKDTNTPLAGVPVTLIPQGTTTGSTLLRITGADGLYSFSGMSSGSYLVQVQDANLNSAYQLYPIDSSLFFTTLEDCKFQQHNFEYGKSTLPVLGDYVWYDTNANGIQDEWYDVNNDGVVTKNTPDENGAVDYNQWEWIDLNGDGSYAGSLNVGELNAGGFGNAQSPNVIIDGPNGYHAEVIVGIEGFWRNRPETANPYGEYKIKLVKDANLDAVAANLGATGLVKVIPSITDKKITNKTAKSQLHTVCATTGGAGGYIVKISPEDLVHLNADFGVNCKVYSDIVANDDTAGPIVGVNVTTPNVLNVLHNDTLEGITVTASDVIITTVTPNAFLQLNPDGSVAVLPNAPAGTLTLVYQICEADQTDNCDTAIVTITISAPPAPPAPVVATDDVYANIGCNTFGLAGNVLSNDFKGLTKASLDLVNFTLLTQNNTAVKTDPNITFDILGNVTVSGLTPAGTYTYSYQICDKINPDNCDTATVTVIVVPNGTTNISGSACNNDSTLINLLSLLPENTPATGSWIDAGNSNSIQGNTLNAFGLALGNYTFEYKITDQNCPRSIILNMQINDDCKVLACGNVIVHNAFSPNGDGINDYFRIDSIDDITCYPENNVEIYNRWGILVFETDNYNNTTNAFDGTSRGRTTVKQSDGLPTGTYFYIVNYKSLDGNNLLQNNKKDGYLYLSK